jgi:hypothetical protein
MLFLIGATLKTSAPTQQMRAEVLDRVDCVRSAVALGYDIDNAEVDAGYICFSPG